MKTRICSSLMLGLIGSMLAACGGGGNNSTDSLNSSSKHLLRSQKAACVAWTSGGTYSAGEVVTYNGASYTALVNQTDYAGTGWNPTVGSLFSAGGSCGGSPSPTPTPTPTPAPTPTPTPAPTPTPTPGCSYSTWTSGVDYYKGTVVKYPANGNFYLEVNNGTNGSDGTDPTISTWYWQPTSCSGSPSPTPTPAPTPTPTPGCSYSTWSAGVDYYKGTVVKYPANGNYYLEVNNGTNGSDGTDPTISTWYWQPTTCSGSPSPTPTPTPGGFVVSQSQFSAMFPSANGFYTYNNLVTAMGKYPAFANTGSTTTKLQEAAAFFANVSHETGGLVYINEIAQAPYCGGGSYPCAAGQEYYGRGPLQISWNYNYGAAGSALGLDLIDNPGLVATDGVVTWETALWYWMTQTGNAGVTPHNSMVNGPNFGQTINAINGGIECGQAAGSVGNQEMQDRVSLYTKFAGMLGVSTGGNTGC